MFTVNVEFLHATSPLSALHGQLLDQTERCGRCSVHNRMFMAHCLACTHSKEKSTDSTTLLMIFFGVVLRKLTLSRAVTVETMFRVS